MVQVYDDLIDFDTAQKVYDWGQSVTWYTAWMRRSHPMFKNMALNEYSPKEEGNFNNRHWLGPVEKPGTEPTYLTEFMRFSMYRRPIGFSTEYVKNTNPIIWDLWTKINEKVFDNKANLDGIPESIAGLRGNPMTFKDGKDFFIKNDIEADHKGNLTHTNKAPIPLWTCYLNARCADMFPRTDQIKDMIGQIHKDTDTSGNWEGKYFTCIYISNLEWQPTWGGAFVYFNEEETGTKHWKHGWNVGWPEHIVGNKPGRLIVYPHDMLHMTMSPLNSAPEMSQRIVFRVSIEP